MAVTVSRFTGSRGCVGDIATLALGIPLFPVERVMRLGSVAEAREAAAERIGWAAVFLRAYALVAQEMPILRTWIGGRLMKSLVTAPGSTATLAINRAEPGDDGRPADRLFFARLRHPEAESLSSIESFVRHHATAPVAEVFKRQLELELTPGPLRRVILRWNMRSRSAKRAARLGTFSLSTLAGFGATNRGHPTLCTSSLSYAPLEPDGRCLVTLICDHRVLDGATAARALARLEELLGGSMVAELAGLTTGPSPTTGTHGPRAAA
jgi:hypothetical protein